MIDLTKQQVELVRSILAENLPGIRVWAFGSRVRGNSKPFSDLDLALMTEKPVPLLTLGKLREAFSDSDLPFMVDLVDWASIDEAFRKVIQSSYWEL